MQISFVIDFFFELFNHFLCIDKDNFFTKLLRN